MDNPLDITIGEPVSSQVNGNNFERFYRLAIPAGGVLTLDAANSAESGGDASFRLVTTSGGFPTPVAQESVPVGENRQIRFITADDDGGTYLVTVQGGMLGAVDFEFTANVAVQDDGGQGVDAPSDRFAGPELTAGTYTGILGNTDGKDGFRFNVPENGIVHVTLENNADSLGVFSAEEQNNDKHVRYWDNNRTATPGNSIHFAADVVDGSLFNVLITAQSTQELAYTLTIEIATQDDAASGADAGEDLATAVPIGFNQQVDGFRAEGESDCYQFATSADQPLTLTLNSLTDEFFGGRPIPRFYDEAGDTLGVGGGPNPGANETVTATAVGATTYLCIAGGGNAAPYSFIVADS
jgi:hypothetical protein